ncbi:DUF2993 domain-containing protein [Gloeocapsopsis dulcis]|uniref:DUF2993 domain-containing protein n=1 Tax=Gloeocapsopsis dulcis AAB1 = 1H9 TaxID=1433147 RepID=A0A6N8FPF6_9CHRO|nr:DUF2993 domain-containing protein [Gloeocapsopsis dulcis]MUL35190.1 hypothetical protein [Gloeocapsopsis dulcis AAB1 = 1H9]WNN89076.1 DUF2993 domain-containing protein [Gloeocapsopsis dulcis]
MELLTILLSGLLGLLSPVGGVVERIAENTIRSQFQQVEQLRVRVDNVPTHQLLQGKIQRIRIAGRSLQLKQNMTIAVLEVETDKVDFDTDSLNRRFQLQHPLQAGVRVVLTEQDVNQALQSDAITSRLLNLTVGELGRRTGQIQQFNFSQPKIQFLANQRLRFQVELTQDNVEPLQITIESGLGIVSGRQLQLIAPIAWVNQEQVPEQILNAIATNFSQQFDLRSLQSTGIQARILQLNISPQKLEVAAFVRVETSSRLLKQLQL